MAAEEETFVRLLHDDIKPLVRQLPDRGRALAQRTAHTVLWVTMSGEPAEAVIESVTWLGAANQRDGFPTTEHVTLGHALVRVARDMSEPNTTSATGSAWIRFFMWLKPHLLAGAEQAAAEQAELAAAEHAAAQQAAAPQEEAPTHPGHPDASQRPTHVPGLLEEEDEPTPSYHQIMLDVTNRRRD